MIEYYIVLYCSDDGDVSIQRLGKEQLRKALNERHWGNTPIRILDQQLPLDLRSVHGLFIFKGSCVQPEAKTVVTEWTF